MREDRVTVHSIIETVVRIDTKGALISQVNENSPAGRAGLKSGDVVVHIDGKEVLNTQQTCAGGGTGA